MEIKKSLLYYILFGYCHQNPGFHFWTFLFIMLIFQFMNSILVKEIGKTIRCYINKESTTPNSSKKAKKNHKLEQ